MIRRILKSFLRPLENRDLVIYDSIYPNPVSGFRLAEFNAYLNHYPDSIIYSEPIDYHILNMDKSEWEIHCNQLPPSISSKIHDIGGLRNILPKLFYCVFINNIYPKMDWIDKNNIPFVFTLYPGGGFHLEDEAALKKLKRVCSSNNLKGIIVTQPLTREYLIKKKLCPAEKIELIFGGIIPQNSMNVQRENYFGKDKTELNICFCAAKYTENGADKGFDIFLEVCERLNKKYDFINFHVVGGFKKEDVIDEELAVSIQFHGYKQYDELQSFFQGQDIILSPNRPFVLSKGAFDGFPLGTVVEAALNGVLPIVTDELNQNTVFTDDEIFICKPYAEDFINTIEILLKQNFKSMSEKTVAKFRAIYSDENQLQQRISYLNKFLN